MVVSSPDSQIVKLFEGFFKVFFFQDAIADHAVMVAIAGQHQPAFPSVRDVGEADIENVGGRPFDGRLCCVICCHRFV